MDAGCIGTRPDPEIENDPGLPGLFLAEPVRPPLDAYTKKTILQSPVVVKVVPEFRVCITKPLAGLSGSYASESEAQTHMPPEQDSFFADDMSEDEAILGLDVSEKPPRVPEPAPAVTSIEILVKATLLLVDGAEYPLTAAVTAVAVVRSPEKMDVLEDSLILTLLSGFQLLVRVWKVPRTFADALFAQLPASVPELPTSHVFKPFVVQWWQLSSRNTGNWACLALAVHSQGSAVVSAGPEPVFRIHACQNTEMGLQLLPHFNIPFDGVLLHACFAHPIDPNMASEQIVLLVVTFTTLSRLALSLYSWHAAELLGENLSKCTLPLNNNFPLPVLIVPLFQNGSFLFVCPHELIVVTLNNVWSADYSFLRYAYDGLFPTSYFLSDAQPDGADEVFLASDTGVVYSVSIIENRVVACLPVLRVADPISSFSLHHAASGDGFVLNYASDTAGAKALYFASLILPETAKRWKKTDRIPYTAATLLKDHKNWAPVVDVLVIDASNPRTHVAQSAQELWVISGTGKRTKLSHLRAGYAVKRELRNFEALRKVEAMYFCRGTGSQFLVFSMPFDTKFFQYVPEVEETETDGPNFTDSDPDPIIEIKDSAFETGCSTLHCLFLPDTDVMFQFTRHSITASNTKLARTSRLTDLRIILADVKGNIAVLAVQKTGKLTLEIVRLASVIDFATTADLILNEACFLVLASLPIRENISMLKCFENSDSLLIACGFFEGSFNLLKFNTFTYEYSFLFLFDLNDILQASGKDPAIPHDVAFSSARSKLYVGTKQGHFYEFDLDDSLSPLLTQSMALGSTPVKLVLSENDPNLLFACMRNVWLFNSYASSAPVRVSFDEKFDKPVLLMVELPTHESQHLRFGFLREDGFVIGSVFCHERPLLRQLSLGDPAKKLLFLDTSNLFVILCKAKNQQNRLKFADRKYFRVLSSMEIDPRTGTSRADWIFAPSETPTCALVWHINRNERVSKKVIVGTLMEGNGGSLKILDISKVMPEGSRVPAVKVVELWSISRDASVSSIQQIGSTILFSCGRCVYSTSYSLESKKFRAVKKVATLSSDVANIEVADDGRVLINTQLDSVLVFKYTEDPDNAQVEDGSKDASDELRVIFKDPVRRSFANATVIGDKLAAGDMLLSELRIFDLEKPSSLLGVSLSLPMIPRVYATNFSAFWGRNDRDCQICCVAVNGQVILISPISNQSEELQNLRKNLGMEYKIIADKALDIIMDRLNRPFMDKITGKGLQSVYKPFFGFGGNHKKFIDYDIEELSKSKSSKITL